MDKRAWRLLLIGAGLIGLTWWLIRKANDMRTPSASLDQFASAIAKAEGFKVPGAVPTRANNPGDLKMGDVGQGVINGITIYPTEADGWIALWKQLDLIARGKSKYYVPTMTIADMAAVYAPGPQSVTWATNVARALKVEPSAVISRWIGDYR